MQFTEVAFGYSRAKILYSGVDLGVDLDSRVAVVGPNGAGKSTLLKLMTGELEPVDGVVKRHNHLRIGVYHQHLAEKLTPDETPLEYMMREFGVRSPGGCSQAVSLCLSHGLCVVPALRWPCLVFTRVLCM